MSMTKKDARDIWGDGEVQHEADAELYAALALAKGGQ